MMVKIPRTVTITRRVTIPRTVTIPRRQDSFVADYGARKPAWISGRGDTRGPGGWGGVGGYPN